MARAGFASDEQGISDGLSAGGRDRRADERLDMERAPGTLIHEGVGIPCEMLDISLGGCRVSTLRPFTAGALEPVKVVLSIHELVLSIWGVTQWTSWDRMVGIRFLHPTGRTRNQLAGLLTCLLDKSAAEVVKRAVAATPREDSPIIALEHPFPPEPELEVAEAVEEEQFQQPPSPPPAPKRVELSSEHTVLSMEEGDSPAVLHLVADGAVLAGSVLDVSQEGCLVRLARGFPVRMNAPAEVDFHLRGLPFRLPGTTAKMHTERRVEIRFTEMSRRKREDLSQAIMELHVLAETQKQQAAAAPQTGESPERQKAR